MRLYYVSGEKDGFLMGQSTAIHDNEFEVVTGPQRIAGLMGLRKKKTGWSHLELVERVEAGLPLSVVENLAKLIDPHDPTLRYEFLSRSTFARLRKAPKPRLTRAMSDRIYGVARVFAAVLDVWHGDEDAANRFLNRPNPLLDGRTPFDVAKESTAGADLVAEILGAARAGVAI
jgi:putative toxin-antitoxin system antitoxin component (TIGR02293 family)